MKKIGVISDTHVPRKSPAVPAAALKVFSGVDLILHAGDLEVMSVLDELEAVAPVKAVCGNMDVFRGEGLLPDRLVVEVEGCRIGLTHGWGAPDGLEERALQSFAKDNVRAVVFGHTHLTCNEWRGGALLFNPGTPTDKRFSQFLSVGILTVDGGAVSGRIIRL